MSIKLSKVFAVVLLSSVALGCDDPEKAQDQCNDLAATYCDRYVECATGANLLGPDFGASDLRSECESYMRQNARCDVAVRVSKTFGQCVDQASALACDDVTWALTSFGTQADRYVNYTLPDACSEAVLYVD